MRFLHLYTFYLMLFAASALAQSPTPRLALPDSAAIANYTAIDRERVLFLFRIMRLGSWHFVWDDSTSRHYGPTAQEFFAAFGADSVGMIGNKEGTSPADVDGIAMIAIQALEDRTQYLRAALAGKDQEINDLRSELTEMKNIAWMMRKAMSDFYVKNLRLQDRLERLERGAEEQAAARMSSLK